MNLLESVFNTFEVSITQQAGLDILATVLIFYSMYLWGKKRRSGFLVNIVASVLWIVWHICWGSVFGAIMNIGLVLMNYWGWKKWK
ncbi:hypothetical protein CSB37_01905 [bacterium DOLZORAL124_38_8]|nr:MAG: hypothetical protein CSB37_01905 [bacterium DOLZORAL124_38_8]